MASRKQETLARTEAWLLNADGTAQPAVLRHVDTSELTKDDPASHPSTSHPMERADGWTYLGRAPPVKWQNVPPGRGVWYEEGERDVIKATFVWSEAKQRHVWDLERVVGQLDHVKCIV